MIGSKAASKMGDKEAAKMGGAGPGAAIGSALSGLAGLFGGQNEPDPVPVPASNPVALAGQAPVNGAQWRPLQPRPQMGLQQGMFERLYRGNPLINPGPMGGIR